MSKRLWNLMAIMAIAALVLAACAPAATPAPTEPPAEEPAEEPAEPLKVAFVYIGPPGDLGWTYEHAVAA